jgi:CRP/FNR family transcriptional regulator, cyclic AMP receptor protein
LTDLTVDAARELRASLLLEQHAICGNVQLAEAIERAGSAIEFSKNESIIRCGEFNDDIFFIIRGSADVVSSGHKHAVRSHRCHVGEMALLDPGLCRSADVISRNDGTVVVRVPGAAMRSIGDQYPIFWRHLGRELAERLRERDRFFVRPNDTPIVFIASSGAAREDLEAIKTSLKGPTIVCRPWTDPNIFKASDFTINSLLKQADEADFAIILATPDDIVEKNSTLRGFLRRRSAKRAARDNVLLEYGLFAGAIDRNRVFVFEKSGVGLPTDLQGLTTLRYSSLDELIEHSRKLKFTIEDAGAFTRMRRERCF